MSGPAAAGGAREHATGGRKAGIESLSGGVMFVVEEPMPDPNRTALLLGATGLVGGHVLGGLLAGRTHGRVRALSRRPLPPHFAETPGFEERVVDFDALPDDPTLYACDDLLVCLGTTIARAGSREAFARIDRDLPLAIARRAHERGARRLLIVSSVGADPHARSHYLRVKGELEREAATLGFDAVHLLRPSMLLGERGERRWKEELAIPVVRALSVAMLGSLRRYRAIEATAVARAMVRLAEEGAAEGVHVHEGADLARWGSG
jgi:uncharacterized protein YbjT (DUF2867 family)